MNQTHLWKRSYLPYVHKPGACLVNDRVTCKVTRDTPLIDPALWVLAQDGRCWWGRRRSARWAGATRK